MGSTTKFRATIELGGTNATGIPVPDEAVEALGAGRKPPVTVTLGGHTYRSTVGSRGGRFMLPLSAENRTAAGVGAGDEVDVVLELDTAPRVVEVPADLAEALDAEPAARQAFDKLSYSHQQRWVLSVEGAKAADTRQRRIDKTVTTLRDGG
jgi:hypothetical protein